MRTEEKLDNPVWYSLSETHAPFTIDFNFTKFYNPDYCPFGAFETAKGTAPHLMEYAKLTDNFYMVGDRPELSKPLKIHKEISCFQMVITERIHIEAHDEILKIAKEHTDIVYELVQLVQPGYFKRKTPLLGNYYGIFKDNQLIALTGERMKMNGFTEVSAVVTHPDHTRKGYAKQLVAHTVNAIFEQGNIPFLHVADTNTRAIKIYEKLGFKIRRKMSFWNIAV